MKTGKDSLMHRLPQRVALSYAAAAGTWGLLSALIASSVPATPQQDTLSGLMEWLLFVAATAVLLHELLRRLVQRESEVLATLKAGRERFMQAAALLPHAFGIMDTELRIIFINDKGLQLARRPMEQVLGRRAADIFPGNVPGTLGELCELANIKRQPQSRTVLLHDHDKDWHYMVDVTPVMNPEGSVREFHFVANNLTDMVLTQRKIRKLTRSLAMLSSANEVLADACTEAELLREFCDTILTPAGHDLIWIGYAGLEDSVVQCAACAGEARAYLDGIVIRCDDSPEGNAPSGRALKTGTAQVCHDIMTDERMTPWRERAAAFGLRSAIAVPLRGCKGVIGIFTLYSNVPGRFDAGEAELLQELADELAYGIESLRSRAALLQETQLREAYMVHSAALIYITDLEGRFMLTNPAVDRALGLSPPDTAVGRKRSELLPQEVAAAHDTNDLKASKLGQPLSVEEINLESGHARTYFTTKFPLRDAHGKIFAVGGISTEISGMKQAEAELRKHIRELESFNQAGVGRELKMIALKKEINELSRALGRPEPYSIDFEL